MTMKTPAFITAGLACLLLVSPHAIAQSSLLIHYTFADGTASDSSGNHHDGRVTPPAKITAPPEGGRPVLDNTAATMGAPASNTGGSIRYSGPELGPLKSFTITMWFRTAPGQSLTQGTRLFAFDGVGPQPLFLGVATNNGTLTFNLGGKKLASHSTPNALLKTPGQWLFVAVVYDGTYDKDNARIFLGSATAPVKLIALDSTKEDVWPGTGPGVQLVFGANSSNGRALSGWLADLRIYGDATQNSAALDPLELQNILNEGIPLKK